VETVAGAMVAGMVVVVRAAVVLAVALAAA